LAARPNAIAAPHENEKSRLKGILGIVVVTQDAAAHAQHHRAVPAHQQLEGVFLPLREEKF
jgi:hypothetical protein